MLWHGLMAGLILSVTALDVLAPAGLDVWVFYFLPLGVALGCYGWKGTCSVAVMCSAMLLLGGPSLGRAFPQGDELGSRILASTALWLLTLSTIRRRRGVWNERSAEHDAFVDREHLQMRLRQLQSQTRQFLTAQEDERRRLARQLHDELGQLLTAIHMQLHLAKDTDGWKAGRALEESLKIVEQAIEQVRGMSHDLQPALLDGFGLLAALQNDLDRQAKRAGLTVNLVAARAWGQLPSEVETTCFRVAHEALNHVIRHASGQPVQVELRRDAEAVHLTIRDDGAGYGPQGAEPGTSQAAEPGLSAMRQRVELLGGTCRVRSSSGQGTVIQVAFPVELSGLPEGQP